MTTVKKSFRAAVFEQVQKRIDNNSATKQDILMFAMFEEIKDLSERNCALSMRLSMCEMLDDSTCKVPELSAIMYGSNKTVAHAVTPGE